MALSGFNYLSVKEGLIFSIGFFEEIHLLCVPVLSYSILGASAFLVEVLNPRKKSEKFSLTHLI